MKKSTIIGLVIVVVVIVIAGAYAATQMGNNSGDTPVGDNPVTIASFAFSPNMIIVHVNDTVTWKNNDGVSHTVTSDSNSTASFNSGTLGSGSTFAFKFTQAGDFWYLCTIHPSMAHAMVRVLPDATG
jgi:plastocyanin